MKIKTLLFTGLLALSVTFFNVAVAQDLKGTADSLYSEILQEQRMLQIILPRDYKPDSKEKYDVLYLLDGEWQTNLASQIEPYVEDQKFMPSSIIVGIINVDRNRDFLPTKVDNFPTSGGADKFIAFLKDELIPYINKKYPSTGENTLFGASFGGIMSTYIYLKNPNLFNAYIAGDPAFWWDNNYMVKLASGKLDSLPSLNKALFIGGREGGAYKGMGIADMDSVFKLKAPTGLNYKFVAYPDETHNSVNFKTMYDGLKFSYSGFGSQVRFHPMNGIVEKGKPLKIMSFNDGKYLTYTLDGSEPSFTSPKLEREIVLDGPAHLNIKLYSSNGKYDQLVSGDFKEGKALPASTKPKKVKPGGFKYSYYEGDWDKLPNLKDLKPIQAGLTNEDFKINDFPRKSNFAVLIEGHLEIKEPGYYVFGLESGVGSKLYLGNQLLIEYNNPLANDAQTYVLPLEKGFYPIKFEHFQKDEEGNLNLFYVTPGANNTSPIPSENQYSLR